LSRSLDAGLPGVRRQGNETFLEDRQDLKLVEGIVAYPAEGFIASAFPRSGE
jgi:hypothetical protein